MSSTVPATTMSTNLNARAAAGQGKNRGKFKQLSRKTFVSDHPDEALKKATFEMGKVVDATQFIKRNQAKVGYSQPFWKKSSCNIV